MNWYLVTASLLALIGIATITVVPAQAPHIAWIGEEPSADQITPPLLITASATAKDPVRKLNDSLGVDMTAISALMLDAQTGAVLYAKNPDVVRTLASITKLMSLMVSIDTIKDLNMSVTIISDDHVPFGTTTLKVGQVVTANDLIAAAVIGSDNTAIRALARATGLTTEHFVAAMNAKAQSLGLSKTSFADVTGLSDQNVSTASEILTFARKAFAYEPIGRFAGKSNYVFSSTDGAEHIIKTTNKLIGSFISVVHGKTGFVTESGYNLVSEITDSKGHDIIGIVLGSATNDDRFHDFKMMAYWVWENFTWPGV